MRRAGIYDQAYGAIEEAIVRGLREARRAVPFEDVARVCHLTWLCTPGQLRESLDRLERRGSIRRVVTAESDGRRPLFAGIASDAYIAAGGGQ